MKTYNVYKLTIGIILLLFAAVYIFTRPALFDIWNFKETGQIGETIGGITAPIISLVGAILVFMSFQAQIEANRIQANALYEEKLLNFTRIQFEKHMLSFEEIKKRLNSIEFIVEHSGTMVGESLYSPPAYVTYTGLNAINEYVLRIESRKDGGFGSYQNQKYNTFGLSLAFQFTLNAIDDLIDRIELNLKDQDDKDYFMKEIKLFYNGFLRKFANRIIECYSEPSKSIKELTEIKEKIEIKIGP